MIPNIKVTYIHMYLVECLTLLACTLGMCVVAVVVSSRMSMRLGAAVAARSTSPASRRAAASRALRLVRMRARALRAAALALSSARRRRAHAVGSPRFDHGGASRRAALARLPHALRCARRVMLDGCNDVLSLSWVVHYI